MLILSYCFSRGGVMILAVVSYRNKAGYPAMESDYIEIPIKSTSYMKYRKLKSPEYTYFTDSIKKMTGTSISPI